MSYPLMLSLCKLGARLNLLQFIEIVVNEDTLLPSLECKMEDFVEKINSMSMDIAQLLHGQNALNSLLSTIQKENKGKKLKIKELQKRVNDLEQYSKMDNLIISGFNVQYKSYARSVSTHDVDEHTQTNSETETI